MSRRAEESASPKPGATTAGGTTNCDGPALGLDAAMDLEEPAVGYFVAGLVSDEPDPAELLASFGSQPRAAVCVEPSTGPEPVINERAWGLRAGESVLNQRTRSRPGCDPLQTAALSPIGDVVSDVDYPAALRRRRVGPCLPRQTGTRPRVISLNMKG